MNWIAAQEERESAMLRVFVMFVFRAVLSICAATGSRGEFRSLPSEDMLFQDEWQTAKGPLSPATAFPRHHTIFRSLCAAEAAAHLLIAMMREPYELLKRAYARTLSARVMACEAAALWERDQTYPDTS